MVVKQRHRGLRPQDLFIASFPRSGNTWVRFVLSDLATGMIQDFETVEQTIPNVGWHKGAPPLASGGGRLIKTHEPHRPEYVRAIYLVRDFRDVLVSAYRIYRSDPDDLSDFDEFVGDFSSRQPTPYGSWTDHVRSWLAARDRLPGIEIHRHEDLAANPVEGFEQLAASVGIVANENRIRAALGRNRKADLQARFGKNIDFVRSSFGYSSRAHEGSTGRWPDLLHERHLKHLRRELELNRELGYEA